jgi:hypothetical protein
MRRWWPHARAVIVAFHLVAITLSAVPSPEGGLNRANWKDPTVQVELAAWAGRFGMAPAAFEEQLWVVAKAYGGMYSDVLAPIRPYESLAGSEQSWKMFVAPHRFPTRLEIAGRAGEGPWEVLFEESSATATWRRETLRLERLRSAIFRWGWPNYSSSWTRGCTSLGALALDDHPTLTEIRCRFYKAKSPSPDEARSGTLPPGKWWGTRVVKRGADGVAQPAVKAADEPVAAGAAK